MIAAACDNIAENWIYPTTQEQERKETEIC